MPKQRYMTIANLSNGSPDSLNPIDANRSCDIDYSFSNIKDKKISDILKLIPTNAIKRVLIPSGSISEGFEYKWCDNFYTWRVRFHGPDSSAPNDSNAALGWIVRVQRGKHYMDSDGNFHSPGIFNTNSPNYNENICNDTHIPVENDL